MRYNKRMKILLIIASLTLVSCKTLEIAHEPLNCIDRPLKPLSDRIELESLASLSDETFDGLEAHIIAYQQRIKSQCELIKRHNNQHEGD